MISNSLWFLLWPTIYWGVYLLISKPIDFISFLGLFHCGPEVILYQDFQSWNFDEISSWPSINISTILKNILFVLEDTYVVLYICQLVKVYNHVVDVVYVLLTFCLSIGIQKISATWLQVTYQLREMIIDLCLFPYNSVRTSLYIFWWHILGIYILVNKPFIVIYCIFNLSKYFIPKVY